MLALPKSPNRPSLEPRALALFRILFALQFLHLLYNAYSAGEELSLNLVRPEPSSPVPSSTPNNSHEPVAGFAIVPTKEQLKRWEQGELQIATERRVLGDNSFEQLFGGGTPKSFSTVVEEKSSEIISLSAVLATLAGLFLLIGLKSNASAFYCCLLGTQLENGLLTLFLFWGMFLPVGKVWSVDNFLMDHEDRVEDQLEGKHVVNYRGYLYCVQLAFITYYYPEGQLSLNTISALLLITIPPALAFIDKFNRALSAVWTLFVLAMAFLPLVDLYLGLESGSFLIFTLWLGLVPREAFSLLQKRTSIRKWAEDNTFEDDLPIKNEYEMVNDLASEIGSEAGNKELAKEQSPCQRDASCQKEPRTSSPNWLGTGLFTTLKDSLMMVMHKDSDIFIVERQMWCECSYLVDSVWRSRWVTLLLAYLLLCPEAMNVFDFYSLKPGFMEIGQYAGTSSSSEDRRLTDGNDGHSLTASLLPSNPFPSLFNNRFMNSHANSDPATWYTIEGFYMSPRDIHTLDGKFELARFTLAEDPSKLNSSQILLNRLRDTPDPWQLQAVREAAPEAGGKWFQFNRIAVYDADSFGRFRIPQNRKVVGLKFDPFDATRALRNSRFRGGSRAGLASELIGRNPEGLLKFLCNSFNGRAGPNDRPEDKLEVMRSMSDQDREDEQPGVVEGFRQPILPQVMRRIQNVVSGFRPDSKKYPHWGRGPKVYVRKGDSLLMNGEAVENGFLGGFRVLKTTLADARIVNGTGGSGGMMSVTVVSENVCFPELVAWALERLERDWVGDDFFR